MMWLILFLLPKYKNELQKYTRAILHDNVVIALSIDLHWSNYHQNNFFFVKNGNYMTINAHNAIDDDNS